MKPQPSDSMMAFVWVLGLVTLTSLKAYHVVWVAKGNSSQWLRYLCLGVAQLLVAATVVTGFMLGTLSDYRESVNAWADLPPSCDAGVHLMPSLWAGALRLPPRGPLKGAAFSFIAKRI
jgi:hypothetical protein